MNFTSHLLLFLVSYLISSLFHLLSSLHHLSSQIYWHITFLCIVFYLYFSFFPIRYTDPDTLNIFYYRPLKFDELDTREYPVNYHWGIPPEVRVRGRVRSRVWNLCVYVCVRLFVVLYLECRVLDILSMLILFFVLRFDFYVYDLIGVYWAILFEIILCNHIIVCFHVLILTSALALVHLQQINKYLNLGRTHVRTGENT